MSRKQLLSYEDIKNASMRIRRAVLGEIKERKEGGLYYTKPFRELMNCILDIEDFLGGTLVSENAKSPDYFYRQMMSFYKSAAFVAKNTSAIIKQANDSLFELKEALQKEIVDLMRFKQRLGGVEIYLYADRIERRKELVKEIDSVRLKVENIGEGNVSFAEFYGYLRGEKEFCEIGAGNAFIDVVRYFYRETVKKYKVKYGLKQGKMYRSDAYALCRVCAGLTDRLSPVYSYLFVDEAQDISPSEFDLLRAINKKAAYNIFGDTAQNVTSWRGVKSWQSVFPDFQVYGLNQNYRNTNQIVDFVSSTLTVDMQPIGYDGPNVERIQPRQISGFFKDKKGLKALICAEDKKAEYLRKTYHDVSVKGKLSKTKINIMSVYESKGLEFSSVVVVAEKMSSSELYIAYTRALQNLAVVEKNK